MILVDSILGVIDAAAVPNWVADVIRRMVTIRIAEQMAVDQITIAIAAKRP